MRFDRRCYKHWRWPTRRETLGASGIEAQDPSQNKTQWSRCWKSRVPLVDIVASSNPDAGRRVANRNRIAGGKGAHQTFIEQRIQLFGAREASIRHLVAFRASFPRSAILHIHGMRK